jgi:hypothetical protein
MAKMPGAENSPTSYGWGIWEGTGEKLHVGGGQREEFGVPLLSVEGQCASTHACFSGESVMFWQGRWGRGRGS